MAEMIFCAPQEYPKLEHLDYNGNDIRLLTELYSGAHSELTAIMQYVYQSNMLHPFNEKAAHALIEISKVEMHHLTMLGEAIRRMGGNPQYIQPVKKQFWHAGLVNYTCDPCSMLLINLRAELDAVDCYLATAKRVCNRCLAPMLERIALDEKIHADIMQHLIRTMGCCRC